MQTASRFSRCAAAVLLCLGAAWAAAILMAPWMVQRGRPGAVRLGGAVVYEIGGRVCHQQTERSFVSAALPWPVCGRCAGLYLSFAAAALAAALARPVRTRAARLPLSAWRAGLIAGLLPTVLSWGLERMHLVAGSASGRAWLAVPAGAVVALLLHAMHAGPAPKPEVD